MLTKEERRSLLKLVRDTIHAKLHEKSFPAFVPESETLKEPRGAFVTLHRHGSLRGCIGYIEAVKPLHKTIQDAAEYVLAEHDMARRGARCDDVARRNTFDVFQRQKDDMVVTKSDRFGQDAPAVTEMNAA